MNLHVVATRADLPGPLVVLVHGTMDRSTAFARAVGELDEFSCVVYDRRGYGRSVDAGPPRDTVDGNVDDLFAVIESVARPDQARESGVVVAGHSFGSHVALGAAGRRPDLIRAVVTYEAPMAWLDFYPPTTAGANALKAPDPTAAVESFMRRMVGEDRWQRLPEPTRIRRRAEGPALLADMAAIRRADAPYEVSEITPPVVVARGSGASPHHAEGARWLAAHLPSAELHELAGAGHGGHTSHPAEFARLVRRAVELAEPAKA